MEVLLDLVKEMGLDPRKVASTGGGEYHCSCPKCGGRDRFFVQPCFKMKKCVGRYGCRHCGIKGDTIQFCREILGLPWKEALKKSRAESLQLGVVPYFERPTSLQINPPPDKWKEKARAFVDWASKEIEKRPDVLDWLAQRGISRDAVKEYEIGYTLNPKKKYGEFRPPRDAFGLPVGKDNRNTIWIPKGIVIPTTESTGAVIRLKIRRDDWQPQDKISKYVVVSGSMQGMNLVGDRDKRVMAVVESELDAYSLHHKVKDFAFVVSVGSNTKNPDGYTGYLAKAKPFLLICHDNDKGGRTMLEKWKRLYPHAQAHPTPTGKDIGEAVKRGLDLREWLLSALPGEFHTAKKE